jgi:hypothetical protein
MQWLSPRSLTTPIFAHVHLSVAKQIFLVVVQVIEIHVKHPRSANLIRSTTFQPLGFSDDLRKTGHVNFQVPALSVPIATARESRVSAAGQFKHAQ